jgi:putative transposase
VSWAIKDRHYSQRRACGLVGLAPKTYRYVSKRPDDSWLRQRLKELASQRFGYRRLHLMLRREGIMLNWKKLYRLYREERLMVRKRGGRKRAQACAGNKGSNGDPSMREPTLVHRLCVRCARWSPQIPHPRRGR